MMKNPRTVSLIIATVCIFVINLTQLLDYLETGHLGGWVSTLCFILADICMVVAWISFFLGKKKKQ